ncbi:MAG: META domain-containing protein [Candidatus Berkiella sp.]
MKIKTYLVGLAMSLSCVTPLFAADELPTVYFQCGDKEIMADFHDGDKLDLTIGHTTYILNVTRSGSGARYETPKGSKPHVLFWNKGTDAIIEVDKKALPQCHQTKAPINKQLSVNSEWTVVQLDGKDLIEGSHLIVNLGNRKGRVTGHTGCNQFSGLYELDGENLKFKGPLASTEMACTKEGMMQQESDFMKLLQSMTHAKIRDGKDLELSNDKGHTILLTK